MMMFGNSDPMTVQTWLFLLSLLLLPGGFFVFIYLSIGAIARDAAKRPRNEVDIFNTLLALAYLLYLPIVAVSTVASTTSFVALVVAVPALTSALFTSAQWNSSKTTPTAFIVATTTVLTCAILWIPIIETQIDPLVQVLLVPTVWLIGYAITMIVAVRDYKRRQPLAALSECPSCGYSLAGIQACICPECGESIPTTPPATPSSTNSTRSETT